MLILIISYSVIPVWSMYPILNKRYRFHVYIISNLLKFDAFYILGYTKQNTIFSTLSALANTAKCSSGHFQILDLRGVARVQDKKFQN